VGWQILPGQVFRSRSFPTDPLGSPLNLRQVVGHPFAGSVANILENESPGVARRHHVIDRSGTL
jgi:hypothetical protein